MFFWCHFGNLDNTQLRLPQCPLTIMWQNFLLWIPYWKSSVLIPRQNV
jgi:hypothetical protein